MHVRDKEPTEDFADPSVGVPGGEEGEVIEGEREVTFVLMVPGRKEVSVEAEEDRLRIEAYDFKMVKLLRCAVDPATAKATLVNGVLSVRLAKRT